MYPLILLIKDQINSIPNTDTISTPVCLALYHLRGVCGCKSEQSLPGHGVFREPELWELHCSALSPLFHLDTSLRKWDYCALAGKDLTPGNFHCLGENTPSLWRERGRGQPRAKSWSGTWPRTCSDRTRWRVTRAFPALQAGELCSPRVSLNNAPPAEQHSSSWPAKSRVKNAQMNTTDKNKVTQRCKQSCY